MLKDYVKKRRDLTAEELLNRKIGRKPVLPEVLENELVNYCMSMENNFYGLTVKDLRRMAFQLAIRNSIKHPFSSTNKAAGRKWMRLFLKRHPQLSLRKPQPLSLARIQGFSPENVQKIFSILEPELMKVNHNPLKIYNVDETGISVVQHVSESCSNERKERNTQNVVSRKRGTGNNSNVHVSCRPLCPSNDDISQKTHESGASGWDSSRNCRGCS
ncbi:hypothetical protein ANN_01188 [Periplaneta americana]|uniref:HTH CENPB-type domain-containing protein n=1 Tax=Periplaneta americana TaxID=6978 RepID=A0ABQ8TSV9_PERAM|nr:hypothetical protein ANN_01188 [Periplaneta americana]